MLIVFFATVAFSLLGYSLVDSVATNEPERHLIQLYGTRLLLGLLLLVLLPGALLRLKSFFSSTTTAKNLAIFRIVFFGFFLIGGVFYIPQLWQSSIDFTELPASSRVDLPFMGWYPALIPFNKPLVTIAIILFSISILAATLGYRTRLFILLFVICAFYLLGIPNFYGKVNHNHHILWISIILAFSPCNHAYSLDAVLGRVKINNAYSQAQKYAQPLRLIWLLIGIIYFFPGFWKMWSCGMDWALTDNVRNHFYAKWFELGGDWLPFFRIDSYPTLYKCMGLFTVFFEFFFIFWLFNKSSRTIGVIAGILFHIGTFIFMNIFFVVLLIGYVSFIPWHRLTRQTEDEPLNEKFDRTNIGMRIGIALIVVLTLFGVGRIHSWPFSVYPTFDTLVPTNTRSIKYDLVFVNQEKIEFDKEQIKEIYQSERFHSLEQQIIENHDNNSVKDMEELTDHLCQIIQQLIGSDDLLEIRVLLNNSSILPEERSKENVELIYRYISKT